MPDKRRLRTTLASLNARLMHSCHDMTRLISQAQDVELPRGTRWKMRLHYLLCVWCRRYRNQLRFLRRALRFRPDAAAETLSSESRARLKQSLRNPPGNTQ